MKTLKTIVVAGMLSLFALTLSAESPKFTFSWNYSFSGGYYSCINEPVTVEYWGTTNYIMLTKKDLFIYHGKVKFSMVGELTGKQYEAKEVYNSAYKVELNGNETNKYEDTYSVWQNGKLIGLVHVVQHLIIMPDQQIEVVLDNYNYDCK